MSDFKIYLDKEQYPNKFKALIAVIEAFNLKYQIEDDDDVLSDEQKY